MPPLVVWLVLREARVAMVLYLAFSASDMALHWLPSSFMTSAKLFTVLFFI